MASTYSPSLKIQLMATGENAGSWGEITNTNLGTAIEEAIVGTADVVFAGSNVTLSLSDTNVSQTARALRLNLTGTSGGARILYLPDTEKSYIVRNTLADQVTVTVVSTPGTSVIVPSGKTMYLYVDSVNVTEAITHVNNFSTTTAIGVTSGGTGQSSFTNGALLLGSGTSGLSTLVGTSIGQIPQWDGNAWVATTTSTGVLSFSAGTTGFTPNTATGGAVVLGGTLNASSGGTGQTSYASGDILYASGSSTLTKLPIGTPGQVLTVAGGVPSWATSAAAGVSSFNSRTGAVNLTSGDVTGALGYTPVNSSTLSGYAQLASTNTFTQSQRINTGGVSSLYLGSGTSQGIQFDGSAIGIGFSTGAFWILYPSYIEAAGTGDVRKPGGGPFNPTSDARLKENVVDYTVGLNGINALRPVKYNYNDVTPLGPSTNHKTFTGLVAQDVQQTPLANMAFEGQDGYLILDTNELTYALVNAVKELSAKVDALQAELDALKG